MPSITRLDWQKLGEIVDAVKASQSVIRITQLKVRKGKAPGFKLAEDFSKMKMFDG
jgi:hypothetical protein